MKKITVSIFFLVHFGIIYGQQEVNVIRENIEEAKFKSKSNFKDYIILNFPKLNSLDYFTIGIEIRFDGIPTKVSFGTEEGEELIPNEKQYLAQLKRFILRNCRWEPAYHILSKNRKKYITSTVWYSIKSRKED